MPQAPAPAAQQAPPAAPRAQRTQPPTVPPEFDGLAIWKLTPPQLLAMVKDPKSTVFQKAIACKKLAFVGGPEAVAPMAALLSHPQLACYARFGLEPNPHPSVDDALRAALPKLKGNLQIGVITTMGMRRDAKSLDALTKLLSDPDHQIVGAAAASVGMTGGMQAARALQAALTKTGVPSFPVVARACLLCAESLMQPNRPKAMELYTQLSETTMPGPVRRAALRVLNSAGPPPAGGKDWIPPTGQAAEDDKSGFLGRGR